MNMDNAIRAIKISNVNDLKFCFLVKRFTFKFGIFALSKTNGVILISKNSNKKSSIISR